jgi:hypothetical protein
MTHATINDEQQAITPTHSIRIMQRHTSRTHLPDDVGRQQQRRHARHESTRFNLKHVQQHVYTLM